MRRRIPADNLVEYKANVFQLEENVVAFEDFLQIWVTELRDDIDLVEIVKRLPLGHQNLYQSYDIWVFAILQQDYFSKNAACFRQGLK